MPRVNGKSYPYTVAGVKASKKAAGKKKATKKKATRKVAASAAGVNAGRIGSARRKAQVRRGARVAAGRGQALAKRIKRSRGR